MPRERHLALEQRPTDHLVHGIVPADILSQNGQFAVSVKKGRGMQSPCASEDRLRGAQFFRKLAKHLRVKSRFRVGTAYSPAAHFGNRLLTANAARRSGGESPGSQRREPNAEP